MIKILGKEFPFPTPEEAVKRRLPWGLQLINILSFIAKKLIPYDEAKKVITVNKLKLGEQTLSVNNDELELNDTPINKSLSDRLDTEMKGVNKSFNEVGKISQAQALEIESLKTSLARLEASKSSLLPVGSILQAFVSEVEFQKQYGTGWVLCDGRSVEGSIYASMFASKIPDCRGRFLRTHGPGSVNVGDPQSEETAVNSLKTSASSVSGGAIAGGINSVPLRTHSVIPSLWEFYGKVWDYPNGRNADRAFGPCIPIASKSSGKWVHEINDGHGHTIKPHTHSHNLHIAGTRKAAAQSLTGGVETRPKNVAINTFIRIN